MKHWLNFLRQWRNYLGLLLLLVMAGVAVAAPRLAPQENPADLQYFRQIGNEFDPRPYPPGEGMILGTLSQQFDVFFTLVWGFRQAFQFGLTVTLAAATFGIIYGATSAYLGGLVNNVMMRIADAFLAFPILAAIVFMQQIIKVLLAKSGAFLSQSTNTWLFWDEATKLQQSLLNIDPVLWGLILFSWMPYARLVNASVLRLRKVDYVASARALGAGHIRIILRHLLPNAISPEVVLAARDVGGMVILQATFTFIGLGGNNAWGELLSRARNWIIGPGGNPFLYWWTYLPVTLALIIFSVSWNFVGDSLNEWVNPRKLA